MNSRKKEQACFGNEEIREEIEEKIENPQNEKEKEENITEPNPHKDVKISDYQKEDNQEHNHGKEAWVKRNGSISSAGSISSHSSNHLTILDARDENANESPHCEDPSSQSEPIVDTVHTVTCGSSDQVKESDIKDTNENEHTETPPTNDVTFNTFMDSSNFNMKGQETSNVDTKERTLESPDKKKMNQTTKIQNATNIVIGKNFQENIELFCFD